MNTRSLRSRLKPHLWFQAYWVVYLVWFFWLDLTITDPKYIIHSPIDDFIPFNEWFVFPYCSWFLLLAAVTALLWWNDTESYDKLCLMMFSGMTFCLILYMVLPNGLDIRPTAEAVGRDNIAMQIMQLLWKADASVNVCPSIHCQSSGCMALAFSQSRLAKGRPGLKVLALYFTEHIFLSSGTRPSSLLPLFRPLQPEVHVRTRFPLFRSLLYLQMVHNLHSGPDLWL